MRDRGMTDWGMRDRGMTHRPNPCSKPLSPNPRSPTPHERSDRERAASEGVVPRGPHRLPPAERARHHAAGVFRRLAAGIVGRDAARLDVRTRGRPRHYRAFVPRRAAIYAEVHLGAGGRCLARALPSSALRAAAGLAHRLAARAYRSDRVPRHARPRERAVDDRPRSAHRRLRLGRRRTSSSTPTAFRRYPRTSRRPVWPATSRPIVSACSPRAPA